MHPSTISCYKTTSTAVQGDSNALGQVSSNIFSASKKYQGEKASPLTLPVAYTDIISEDIIQHKITAAKWGQPQLKQNKQQAQK